MTKAKLKADPLISNVALKVAIFDNCQVVAIDSLMQPITEEVAATGVKPQDRQWQIYAVEDLVSFHRSWIAILT